MTARAVYGPGFQRARAEAIARSGGACQLCGSAEATEAHHWAVRYPDDDNVAAGDLTALCSACHTTATTFRRFLRRGGDRWQSNTCSRRR